MIVRSVTADTLTDYVDYARRHGREHDESFLPDEGFRPDDEHPALLLRDDTGRVAGAAGLLLTGPYRNAGRGRITLMHAVSGGADAYGLLTAALREAAGRAGAEGAALYGFLPARLAATAAAWRACGWDEERRSFLMVNDDTQVPDDVPPEGFSWSVVTADSVRGQQEWRDLINRNFADIAGHVELTRERVREMTLEENIGGGLEMLLGPDGPAGTLLAKVDEDEPTGSFLGCLSLNADLRGRGLGRLLLRRGLALSRRAGLSPTWLSVNAENDNAVKLYLSEGFRTEKVMVCYVHTGRTDAGTCEYGRT